MRSFGPDEADISVFTQKEGLLSAVAHDLHITATDFTLKVHDDEPRSVELTIAADKLRVVTAMKNGQPQPSALSESDRKKIAQSIQKDVLHTSKHGSIVFKSTAVKLIDNALVVDGQLKLHGQERKLSVQVRQQGDDWVASTELHQPDYGIKPYRALMGTLKVAPDVRVVVRVKRAAD